jgi:hypothetical protein
LKRSILNLKRLARAFSWILIWRLRKNAFQKFLLLLFTQNDFRGIGPVLFQHQKLTTMVKQSKTRLLSALGLLLFALQIAVGQGLDTSIFSVPSTVLEVSPVVVSRPAPPDTLLMGEFVIIVERYDSVGRFSRPERSFSGLRGIGRVLFSCQPRYFPPFWPGGVVFEGSHLPLSSMRFQVVDSVADPAREVSISTARVFDKNIERGAALTLALPLATPSKTAGVLLADLARELRPGRPEGIRVQFDDLTVRLLEGRRRAGRVLFGSAEYPAKEPIPLPPFSLEIEGFTLEISTLTIFHDRPARALARLVLPDLMSAGEDCARATLELGRISLSPKCEFYENKANANYGPFGIGNTTLVAAGQGFIADFSSTAGSSLEGGSATWKGVILLNGKTAASPSGTVISNTGYLQAGYSFGAASVTRDGFSGTLNTGNAYTFSSVQPFGYTFTANYAELKLQDNYVKSGVLNNVELALPAEAVQDRNGQSIQLFAKAVMVVGEYGLIANVDDEKLPQKEFFWGDYTRPGKEIMAFGVSGCRTGLAFFPSEHQRDFYPVAGDAFAEPNWSGINTFAALKASTISGVLLGNPNRLYVQSPDVPGPHKAYPLGTNYLEYFLSGSESRKFGASGWLDFQSQGVHAVLYSSYPSREPQKIGDPASPYYVGQVPFVFGGFYSPNNAAAAPKQGSIVMRFVESATFHSDVQGWLQLPQPTASTLYVKELCFTSTAQIAGGKVDLSTPAELAYWGLQLVPRPGFSAAGVLSVKTGQVILTGAGLAEKRHFKEPFYVTWGELLANGSLGRLFFDYHTAGQKFDGFDFTPEAVALSDYGGSSPPFGFLRVGGTAHFPFFGGNYLHILDQYDPAQAGAPFNKRTIQLETNPFGTGFFASDLTAYGNWSDGLGVFDITQLRYNDLVQDGFLGDGTSTLRLLGDALPALLTLRDGDACVSLIPGTEVRDLRFDVFADITSMTQIWGCICVRDDRISDIVVGGSLTQSSNTLMIAARTGQYMSAIVHISPSTYELTLDGSSTISLTLSLDMEVSGHLSLKYDAGNNFVEGEADGYFRAAAGVVLAGGSLSGQGQANWHIGLDPTDGDAYQSIQGSISMNVMSVAVWVDFTPPFVHSAGNGAGLAAGFYLGRNAPKSDAWVLLGSNPRYQLNMAALPERLTGVYGYVQIKQDLNVAFLSGGYEIFVGLGAFVLDVTQAAGLGGIGAPGIPYAIGHLGGRVHGEFLGGLVGGSVWIDLQLIGPYPFHFEGTVGLEACVLWVACTTYDITIGVNTAEGFYVK